MVHVYYGILLLISLFSGRYLWTHFADMCNCLSNRIGFKTEHTDFSSREINTVVSQVRDSQLKVMLLIVLNQEKRRGYVVYEVKQSDSCPRCVGAAFPAELSSNTYQSSEWTFFTCVMFWAHSYDWQIFGEKPCASYHMVVTYSTNECDWKGISVIDNKNMSSDDLS